MGGGAGRDAGRDAGIRAFTADDLDAAAALYVATFNAAPWHDQWTLATARRRLADMLALPGAVGLVCAADDLLGLAVGAREQWFDGLHFHLQELCIHPRWQRQGHGARLLRALEAVLREHGVSRVYLVTAGAGPAAAFYAKHGYDTSPTMRLLAHRLQEV